MKFIKLTDKSGNAIRVNYESIDRYGTSEAGTHVQVGYSPVFVKETPEEIDRLIEKAKNRWWRQNEMKLLKQDMERRTKWRQRNVM